MSARDYRRLASVIEAVGSTGGDTETLLTVAERLAKLLKDDHPRFDFARLYVACGFAVGSYGCECGEHSAPVFPLPKEGS